MDPSAKQRATVEAASSSWAGQLSRASPPPQIFLSALGTTRAAAGGLAGQRAIDLDLNVAMARAARDAGARVYVLVSSSGANAASMSGYLRMKGELEEAVGSMGFETAVILRPGLIMGARQESRPAEAALRFIAGALGRVNTRYLKDTWVQDADVIGRAAVAAGLAALDGKAPAGKVWDVGMGDIVRLGRTEWTGS